MPYRELIGLSGFAVGVPVLCGWAKLWIWALHERHDVQ